MSHSMPNPEETSHFDPVDEVVGEYLLRLDRGERVDREAFIAAHPGIAADLRKFFADNDALGRRLKSGPEVRTSEPAARDSIPARLGDYELLEELGRGGMGVVYKARHARLGRLSAVKVLPKEWLSSTAAVDRFRREMLAVGSLDHSNVVRAFDAREIDGTPILVMELVEGLNIAEVVRRGKRLNVADAAEVIRQAALGLQCAHEAGLVHRDVKPSNLILTPAGQIKLLDLGLARFRDDLAGSGGVTATGVALGTADYVAPEQARDARGVDIRADIYSLGCTLYKLLAGYPPFAGPSHRSVASKLAAHMQENVLPIARSDLPGELAAAIRTMLSKDPARRYATPAEVAAVMQSFAKGSDLRGLWDRVQTVSLAAAQPETPPALPPAETEWQVSVSSGEASG